MLIRYASDLHMEFLRQLDTGLLAEHMLPPDSRDAGAVLVLAGDISGIPGQLLDFLYAMEDRFLHVIYVPGNHEYYGHEMQDWNRAATSWQNGMRRTVVAAGRVAVESILGLTFVVGTLWGDGGNPGPEREAVGRGLHDFRVIRYGSGVFTPDDMAFLNKEQRAAMFGAMRRVAGPVVAVSHHLPSPSLCHPRFGTAINGGFASSADYLMLGEHAPVLWVHGHTHDTIDTRIGRTRVVCNPAGYRPEWNTTFNNYFAAPKFAEVPLA